MRLFVGILLLTVLALVATRPTFLKLRRATLFGALISGGWLGVLAGLALGPNGTGMIDHDIILQSAPLLTIGLGWIGLMVGLQLRWELLRQLPASIVRLMALDSIVSIVVFAALAVAGMRWWIPDASLVELATPVALLAACAIGWNPEMRSLRLTHATNMNQAAALTGASSLAAPVAIVVFTVGAAAVQENIAHAGSFDLISAALRLVSLALIAVVLGFVARFGLRKAGTNRSELLVIFLGVAALITGAATELGMSPLFSSMLAGAVIANLAGRELRRFERFVLEAEHVVATLFWVVAGVLLDVEIELIVLGIAGMFVLARVGLKPALVTWEMRRLDGTGAEGNPRLRRLAPIRQSPLAMMLCVSLVLSEPSPLSHQLLTLAALTGLLCDLIAVIGSLRSPVAAHVNQPSEDAREQTAPVEDPR